MVDCDQDWAEHPQALRLASSHPGPSGIVWGQGYGNGLRRTHTEGTKLIVPAPGFR